MAFAVSCPAQTPGRAYKKFPGGNYYGLKNPMKKKCTEADYRFFVKECKKWIKEFGLTDWQIYFEKVDMESYGNCLLDGKNRTVTMAFCKEWGENELRPKTRDEISRTAFHEVLHIVIYSLEYLADIRHVSRGEISEAAEALVVRLTNFYFKRIT